MNDLRTQLQKILQGRVCLVGVGNVELGDDGLGVRLAEEFGDLRFAIHDLRVVVAGCSPERCLAELSSGDFDNVMFLDAIAFGGEPGSVVLLDSAAMATRLPQLSTHRLSLGLLAKLIEASGATRAWLLGVQPGSLKPHIGLSLAAQRTLEVLKELLRNKGEGGVDQSALCNPQTAIVC